MHGYNPGQFQQSRPPPPGGVPPPQPMAPGVGFHSPAMPMGPPPPGGNMQPGAGFAPPGPGRPGMNQPPPPGGMHAINTGMGGMNLNNQHSGFQQPGPPGAPPPPGQPGMGQPGMGQPGMGHPGMGQPGMGQPGMGQPGMGQGMGQPTSPNGTPMMAPGFVDASVDYSIKIPETMFRVTSSTIPATAAMVTACKVPTGGVLRPFTKPEEGEVNVISPGASGIIRCHRCRTYINPYVAWFDNGRKWRCNICGHNNETSSQYYCHLDANNQRKDKDIRPELNSGIVEWKAPPEYQVRAPQPPTYFFVLDVSAGAVASGMLEAAANSIKRSLDDLPGGDRTMIGFITYDTSVHYYSLAPGSANAQMMVVGDLKELFVPAPTDLLVYLKDSREAVDNLLDNLPTMFANNTAGASCLGPSLKAAFTVMKSVGGKMSVFQSVLPTLGDGALKPRENLRMMGTPDEVKLLRPATTFYKDTALEFSKHHISVDMYIFPSQFIDIASMSQLPKLTAGTLNSYVGFDIQKDGPKFESQLYRRLTQPTAFEAVLRIRCTKGMRITNFYGNFNIRGQDLLALPNCTPDSVFGFDLNHDEQSINAPFVTIQSALLFTTSDGERRIRVATQAIRVTNRASEFMASVDSDAVAVLLSKQALNVALKTNLDNARNKLQHTCIEMIKSSKLGDQRVVSGFKVPTSPKEDDKNLPENLELLPLYTLALMKNVAFRGGTDVNPDERITAQMMLSSLFIEDAISFIHPRLYGIHNMSSQSGLPLNDDAGGDDIKTAGRNMILLPKAISLTVDQLSSEGVYLLDNGSDSFIWVGRTSDAATNNALFGLDSLDGIDTQKVMLNSSGNDLASRLDSIIEALREESENNASPVLSRIKIIREGDMGMEARFFWNFIEDRAQFNGGTYNYEEFVQHVTSPNAGHGGPQGGPGGPQGANPRMGPGGHQGMAPPGPMGQGGHQGMGRPGHQGMAPPGPMGPSGHQGMGRPGPPGMAPSGPLPPGQPAMPQPRHHGGPLPPGQPPAGGFGGPPPPGPPSGGGFGGPPPPGPPGGGGFGGPPPPGPPSSGGFGGPPPPGPPSAGGFGGPPPPGPPSAGGFGGPPPPGPPSAGGFGGPPPPGPPSSGGYGGPPPPGSFGGPPRSGPPPPGGMPPPPGSHY